jgi:hypothetical protein
MCRNGNQDCLGTTFYNKGLFDCSDIGCECVCVFFTCFWVGSYLNWKHVLSGQNILNPMGKLWAKITIFP